MLNANSSEKFSFLVYSPFVMAKFYFDLCEVVSCMQIDYLQ